MIADKRRGEHQPFRAMDSNDITRLPGCICGSILTHVTGRACTYEMFLKDRQGMRRSKYMFVSANVSPDRLHPLCFLPRR